jgi:hypothetical protein
MKVTEIAITRKFNIGNYQTIDYHIEASLDETEDPKTALYTLEKIINDYWSSRTNTLETLPKKQ